MDKPRGNVLPGAGILLLLSAFLLAACSLPEQGGKLDHFKVYEVERETATHTVKLKGQFDKEPRSVDLAFLGAFANPVQKDEEKIHDPTAHLTWYFFDQDEPKRTVTLSNQFGEQTWKIGDSSWLLVPATKDPHEAPKNLDHFKCYSVVEGKEIEKERVLRDQFDEARGKEEKVTKLKPEFFCVPVEKEWKDEKKKIKNPNEHLAVYRITPEDTLIPPLEKRVEDQFKRYTLKVKKSIFLAVPSRKVRWKEGH